MASEGAVVEAVIVVEAGAAVDTDGSGVAASPREVLVDLRAGAAVAGVVGGVTVARAPTITTSLTLS